MRWSWRLIVRFAVLSGGRRDLRAHLFDLLPLGNLRQRHAQHVVVAADPVTGVIADKPVTDVITGTGIRDLVRISIDANGDGQSDILTGTAGHPFYVSRKGWTDSGELRRGDVLFPGGTDSSVVMSTYRYYSHSMVYNLTVADIHTYFVMADDQPTLVHNCPRKKSKGSEHTKGKRKSTVEKHQKGQGRKGRDSKGGEKGDRNRPYQR
jgi:hypothetical protein